MQTSWDLSVFYKGFDDPAFARDLQALPGAIAEADAAIRAETDDHAAKLRALIERLNALDELMERLSLMIELTLSCDAEHEQANAAITPLMNADVANRLMRMAFRRYVASIPDLDAVISSDKTLRENAFALRECAERMKHWMDEAIEGPVLRMQSSGGVMFSQLRDKLDATLLVDYKGEQLPLSAVRAMASSPDAAVRREAYEAELASYKKVELPMGYCLNAIKAEARTIAELCGFDSVLSMTLFESRMDEKTLDSMWTAIREKLPELREFFKAKAKLLGHENGLPFYDLFAPLGASERTYPAEEARDLLLRVFRPFSAEMADMMNAAFEDGWIDLYPKAGKGGGAFCAGSYALNVSRILANHTGSLEGVSTLAHELGHAFNNLMLHRAPRMMTDTPMPLAETASTFNETLLCAELSKSATAEEELMLLDQDLTGCLQTMVDIYSRFLFEQKVVNAQADHALSAKELCNLMLWAQDETYGDGLDPAFRHPYMWACKGHYYSAGMHFYNFPYAFGCLFSRGLYAMYKQQGESFVPVYCDLLSRFGSGSIADVAASVGIDVTTPAFWREAVESVLGEVRRFVALAEKA